MATNRVSSRKHTDQAAKQLRRKASELNRNLHDMGGIATKVARAKASEVQDRAAQYVDVGIEKWDEVQDAFVGYIRENPFRSTLIAAGIGLVIGRLVMRR
jgi:ElaB/YqjD/DUF883 family membrane-anchored ribosome-binding protein